MVGNVGTSWDPQPYRIEHIHEVTKWGLSQQLLGEGWLLQELTQRLLSGLYNGCIQFWLRHFLLFNNPQKIYFDLLWNCKLFLIVCLSRRVVGATNDEAEANKGTAHALPEWNSNSLLLGVQWVVNTFILYILQYKSVGGTIFSLYKHNMWTKNFNFQEIFYTLLCVDTKAITSHVL